MIYVFYIDTLDRLYLLLLRHLWALPRPLKMGG